MQSSLCLKMQFPPYLLLVKMHLLFPKTDGRLLATQLAGAAQRYGLLVHITKFRQNRRIEQGGGENQTGNDHLKKPQQNRKLNSCFKFHY